MIDRVILMCAGRAQRWGNYLGTPKHLISIKGESLLDRTIRLVTSRSNAAITIVAFDPQYSRPGCERFEPAHGPADFCDTDKFLSSQSCWSPTGQTVILYGDVFFTDRAMKKILAYQGPHRFYGRREWSYFTGRPWRELFALSFPAAECQLMLEQLNQVRSNLLTGLTTHGGGWELYHHMHASTWDNFTSIDDFTDDFDFPSDYDKWIRRYNNPLHRLTVPLWSQQLKHWQWRLRAWSRKLRAALPQLSS